MAAQILIIPGNPGNSDFYISFMKELGKFNFDINILQSHFDNLEDHIQDIVINLEMINRPTIVIGHSIGAYMLLHAMSRIRNVNIVKVVAMYPFLEPDFSVPRVRNLAMISRYYTIIGYLAGALSYLPHWIKSKMFRYLSKDKMDDHAVETCCKLLTMSNLRKYLYFANGYIKREIQFDWKLITSLGSLLVVYACPNDTWMSESLYTKLCGLPGVNIEWHEDMTHAFIVSNKMCKLASRRISALI